MDRARRTSVAPLDKRRASNVFDRYRRQARNSVWYESADGPSFDDPFGKGSNTRIRPPRRADTNLAPTEVHPGYRIPVPIEARIGSTQEDRTQGVDDFAPGHKTLQHADSNRWSAPGRKESKDEVSRIRSEIAGLPHNDAKPGIFRQVFRNLNRSPSPEYNGIKGLRISTAGLAAHATAPLFLDAGPQRNKQRVFMAEYMDGNFPNICALTFTYTKIPIQSLRAPHQMCTNSPVNTRSIAVGPRMSRKCFSRYHSPRKKGRRKLNFYADFTYMYAEGDVSLENPLSW